MANRHLSRSIVLQTIFEWDFGGQKDAEISGILDQNIKEFLDPAKDSSVSGVNILQNTNVRVVLVQNDGSSLKKINRFLNKVK